MTKTIKTIKTTLIKFLNSIDFGQMVANDYYGGINQHYMADLKQFNKNKNEAVNILQELGKITDDEIKDACKNAFSGRLEYNGDKFKYIAGQFYNIEVPQAVLAVAEYIKRQRDNS